MLPGKYLAMYYEPFFLISKYFLEHGSIVFLGSL